MDKSILPWRRRSSVVPTEESVNPEPMRNYTGNAVTKRQAREELLRVRGPLPLLCDDCSQPVIKFGNDYGHVHHRDHDPLNNSAENLSLLDAVCHRKHHSNSAVTFERRRQASLERDAASNLQTPEVFAKRTATRTARYAAEPELHQALSVAVKKRFEDPEYIAKHQAAMQSAWDDNDARRQHMSKVSRASFTNGVQIKISCPNGCGLETFPGPMGRHTKAGKCQPIE